MPKWMFVLAVFFSISFAIQSNAQSYKAPSFVPGTEFVFHTEKFGNASGQIDLKYIGLDQKGNYNFGSRVFSPALKMADMGKVPYAAFPVKFPLALGQKWEYSYTFDRSPRCFDQTDTMKAQVASSLENATVNGSKLEVIRIKHVGRWLAHCPGGAPQGNLQTEYLYSPKLGMFVSTSVKVWSPGQELIINNDTKLVSFKVPEKH